MITGIKFFLKKASIFSVFEWQNIPKFAVIAGINGAGKTQLLQQIQGSINQINNNLQKEQYASISYLDKNKLQLHYQSSEPNITGLGDNQKTIDSAKIALNIIDYVRNKTKPKNNNDYDKIINYVEKKSGQLITDLSDGQINENLPSDLPRWIINGFQNVSIAEVFEAYHERLTQIKAKLYDEHKQLTEDEIYEQIGMTPPWKMINELFAQYGFAYKIDEPIYGVSYVPRFVDKIEDYKIPFSALSTGEKIIVTLLLWACNERLGNKVNILLLDEIDAHLNSSISKMFIEVVKEKLVKEFGIQVIMTTHHPSTVAYVDDESLFWMERGKNIRNSNKNEIIPMLSDGIMTFQEASHYIVQVVNSKKQTIAFTEGKTDVFHINIAREKLGIETFFDIFPIGDDEGGGSNKLKQFLVSCPQAIFGNHNVIGIFDYDTDTLKIVKDFERISKNLYKSLSNPNVYALLLPCPNVEFEQYKNCPIEYLYPKSILEEYGMIGRKKSISDVNKYHEEKPFNQTDYDMKHEPYFYQINSRNKVKFSQAIVNLEPQYFENFKSLFDVLASIQKVEIADAAIA